ncbi:MULTISPECIES: hypothetical protein [Reichenbachiella]|uniref:Uncharacterized protein n=1 Tax=Reichenbachiella agariperforans TaxID=156994 RepID=A0A1M6SV48_REIAG|nr:MULTISPECIES: hypothetical protein [Reichenbachiella]MBU2916283.1 hypothetical protein [Reichenbachiella agariperforans]RJE75129.1 hypothetical protein BGP76_18645 [Reichenbachiella sp. MSK19-1]SHK48458.1 hypothetical protein SAMN04488028_105163 [Reichenbachiella agariperforans]
MKKVMVMLLMVTVNHLVAQDIDPKKMERDLRISEDVIGSLVKSESEEGEYFSVKVSANYVPNFGVMIKIDRLGHFSSSNIHSDFDFHWQFNDEEWQMNLDEMQANAERIAAEMEMEAHHQEEIAMREYERTRRKSERVREKDERKESDDIEIIIEDNRGERYTVIETPESPEGVEHGVVVVRRTNESTDGGQEEYQNLFHEVIRVYLADYANLMSQLRPEDKVLLTTEVGLNKSSDPRFKISAYVLVDDIMAKNSGKLSVEKFQEKIVFSETEISHKKMADLELLASIFQRLYKSDLATTYYTSERVQYEMLDHFGAVFKMKMYSSVQYGKDNYKVVANGKTGLTESERNQIVSELYPQFEYELIENVLDYGKTVKSLRSDEYLVFQIKLTQCNGCAIPKDLKVTVQQSVLDNYNQGKIKRDEALSKISIDTGH